MRLLKVLPDNIYQFASWDMIDEIPDFDFHIDKVFDTFEAMIATRYNYLQMYKSEKKDSLNQLNSEYMKYNALLIYDGQLDLPKKFFTEKSNEVIAKIKSATDELEKENLSHSLKRFILLAEQNLNLKIHNPF